MTGRTILQYEIGEKIGEGGMGVVFKAHDRNLNRSVALKFLPAHLAAAPDVKHRFLREASAISAVNHPHIAIIHDLAEVDDQRFLVFEYLPGGTLQSKLRRMREEGRYFSISEILRYGLQTACALAHAHRHGLVHRDVKTSNLMLTEEGEIKVTDFGIAKLSGTNDQPTLDGTLVGTIAYMSPEQAQGLDVDARSDIFSFGVVLFEITTGRLPFEASSQSALLGQVIRAPTPALRRFRVDAPAGLERIVEKALRKDRDQRYQSMDEVIHDLQAVEDTLSGQTLADTSTLARYQAWHLPGRRARLIGVLTIAGVGGVAVGLSPAIRERISEFSMRQNIPAEKLLAVLPFKSIETDSANIALCDGMTEILTNRLTQLEQFHGSLRVISSNDVLREKLSSTREARSRFGATLALTGSLRRANGSVVVTTNLVDTRNQLTLVARTIEGPGPEMADIEQRLLQKVAEMLQLQLQPEAQRLLAQIQPSTAPGAYEFYLQGRGYLQRRDRVENLENAILVFDRALARDPNYALAYAGRAEAYWRRYDNTKDPQYLESARLSCLSAVKLNDRLAPVHVTMGLVHMSGGKYGDAIKSFQKAVEIDRVNADAIRELANAYDKSGRPKEAEDKFRLAIELRPHDWAGYRDLGAFLDVHGRREEAVIAFKKVIELTPDNYSAFRSLGGLYLKLDRLDDAAAMLKKSLEIKPFDRTYSNLGTIYYVQKRYREASDMYRKAVDMTPTDSALWGNLADAYRWIPDLESAHVAYRRAVELGEQQLTINPKDSQLRSKVAMYYSALGENDKAVRHAARAVSEAPNIGFVQYRAALAYEGNTMRGRALSALAAALNAGYSIVEIRAEPALAELREDPRFRVLEHKYASKFGRAN